jgi:hypothetical protein
MDCKKESTMNYLKYFSLTIFLSASSSNTFSMELSALLEARLKEVLPLDAAGYVSNYRICRHWQGEPAYDEERARQIKKGIEENCRELEKTRIEIEKKYPAASKEQHVISSILKEVNTGNSIPSFVFNDPERKSKALVAYYREKVQSIANALTEQVPRHERAIKYAREKKAPPNASESLETTGYLLNVQQRYLQDVTQNMDRLDKKSISILKQCQEKLTAALNLTESLSQPNK